MPDNDEPSPPVEWDRGEYVLVPEEALELLPAEMRSHFMEQAEDGRAVLRLVDAELNQAAKLSRSYSAIATLRYIQQRLESYRFSADMDAIHELDLLTTAFVVTYVRLQRGGGTSGFEREALPPQLRSEHDRIIDLRNKRFAHEADHHTITDMMEIGMTDGAFEIQPALNIRVQIGGSPDWRDLVAAVEALMIQRAERLIERLQAKTGRAWKYAQR